MLLPFLLGATATASVVTALFFLRFWRTSGERLFLIFSAAFAVLALNWVGLAMLHPRNETQHYLFLVRLLAFVLIIGGIIDKNRGRP